MNMMNRCAKFHKDSPSNKKVKSISWARLNFRRRPFLCTTLYRNLMQASNFGGTFDQFFLWTFLWNFHRRCLSSVFIPWCKKSQKSPKTQIKGGSCLKHDTSRIWNGCATLMFDDCWVLSHQPKFEGQKFWTDLSILSSSTLATGNGYNFWCGLRPANLSWRKKKMINAFWEK